MNRDICYTGGDYLFAPVQVAHVSFLDEEDVEALGEIAGDILRGEKPDFACPRKAGDVEVCWHLRESGWSIEFRCGAITVVTDADADDLRWLAGAASSSGVEFLIEENRRREDACLAEAEDEQ